MEIKKVFLKRWIRLSVFMSIVLILFSIFSCGGAADQTSTQSLEQYPEEIITDQSLSQYKIYVLGNDNALNFAAKELSERLSKLTKTDIKIYQENFFRKEFLNEKAIILGTEKNINLLKALNSSLKTTKDEAFLLKSKGNSLIIIGKKPIGTIYGVYEFLEKYVGFKWLSKDYEYIPKNVNFDLSKINEINKPRFIYREVFINEGDNPDFALKLRDNGRLGHRNLIPLKYGNVFIKGAHELIPEKYKKSHPEFFCGGQLDYTLNKVKKIALKSVNRELKKLDNSIHYYFVIGHRDIGSYCTNDMSRRSIKRGGSPATPYIEFVSYIARKLKDRYPNVTFLASAYQWSRKPPNSTVSIPDNMGIFFSDIDADFSKPLKHPVNRHILNDLNGWTKLTKHILIWHYITNFNNYLQPFPNIKATYIDIKTFAKIPEVKGIFLQGAYGQVTGDLSDLKLWVFSKLLWNPNQKLGDLLREFTNYYYGKGAPYIRKYITLTYKSIRNNPTPLFAKTPPSVPYLNVEYFIKAEDLFNKALKAVKGNKELENRIKKAKLSVDVLLLLNKGKLENEAMEKGLPWFDEAYLQNLLEEIKQTIKRENLKGYSEGGKIEDLIQILSLNRKAAYIPDEAIGLKEGKDWFDFQEYTLTNCCGTRLEEDYLASDGVAVTLPGNTPVWGIQMNLGYLPPEGKWKMYFRIRISLKKNDINLIDKIKFAFRYGVYPLTRGHVGFITSFIDEEYHTVEVGTFERNKNASLWIAPPNNDLVEKIYVDRVFIVREN